MVVPAPLVGVFRNPALDFAGNVGGEVVLLRLVFGREILLEADDDAFFAAHLAADFDVSRFRPGAEDDDARAHLVDFLREPQVHRGRLPEERDGVALGVLALVEYHREDALGAEELADEFARLFGVVFGEVRVAAQFLEHIAEGGVADGIGDELHVFAVAAEGAVHQFERPLVDADAGDGHALLGAIGDGVADEFLVLVDDAVGGALDAGEAAVRVKRIPEDALEYVARGHFLQRLGAVYTSGVV